MPCRLIALQYHILRGPSGKTDPALLVCDHILSQNTYEEAAQYFRAHFLQAHRKNDASKRTLFTVRDLLQNFDYGRD